MSSLVVVVIWEILGHSTYCECATGAERIHVSCDEDEDRRALFQGEGHDVVVEGGQSLLVQ